MRFGTYVMEPAVGKARGRDGYVVVFTVHHLAGLMLAGATIPDAFGQRFPCHRVFECLFGGMIIFDPLPV
ncbi:hypothetical protein HK16_05680 [Acetobacter senegalensis]|uniref:Uncharacterized protein n=1 Tax=Acetobacter senegalensis TaxID=446692 RepID=A0A252EN29_9PROT|nr:hypothetical protein HK16_05680 [Acetobacter senegalensis]